MNESARSPLQPLLTEAGGVTTDYHGRPVTRHFGDPAAEYRAATEAAAVFDRSHRGRYRVRGRAPGQMLKGVLTGTMPDAPHPSAEGVTAGRATYHAVLTSKGKMVTDLWVMLLGEEDSGGYLLDVPVSGRRPLIDNLARVLPPRFAAVADASDQTAHVTVVGPHASSVLSRLALGLRVEADELTDLDEGEWRVVGDPPDRGLVVERTRDVWPEAFSVIGPAERVAALWRSLVEDGVVPAGLGVWSTLRVEAGRPAFGTDMDEGTIPIEAGIDARAIDHGKGCYTGQEVIVRIRDRGHVNRRLHLLQLGQVPTPSAGTELHSGDEPGKVVGRVTSAVDSPRFGGVIALAYVRRDTPVVLLDGREITLPAEDDSAG